MKTEFNSIFSAIAAFKKLAEKTEKGISKTLDVNICNGYLNLSCYGENYNIHCELMQSGYYKQSTKFVLGFVEYIEQ
jgi:hypothetical protein